MQDYKRVIYSPTLKGMILFLNYNWDEYHYTPLFIYKYDFFLAINKYVNLFIN
jgi:hypothetical protein